MPKIPIYNPRTQIQGQAGSTIVPTISQSSTSGAIASQSDTLSKSLIAVSDFANVLIKNESERIVSQEAIKYKTLLDTTQKNIQTQFADQPEMWMQKYEDAKSLIVNEINNNTYKYDFIKNQVSNQVELDYLPLRNTLFSEYTKQTKIQNSLRNQEIALDSGKSLGSYVNQGQEDFEYILGQTIDHILKYSQSNSASSSKKLQTDAFTNAALSGLDAIYGSGDALTNSFLQLNDIENENLKEIFSYLDLEDQEKIMDDFRDANDDIYDRKTKLEDDSLKDNIENTDLLINQLWETNDDKKRRELFNKIINVPLSYFGDDAAQKKARVVNWFKSAYDNDEELYAPQSSLFDNPDLVADLKILIREEDLNFTDKQIFDQLPNLSLRDQNELRTFADSERDENSKRFRKAISSEFQLSSIDGNIIMDLDGNTTTSQVIKQMAIFAYGLYDKEFALQGEKFNPQKTFNDVIAQTKSKFKIAIINELQEAINNIAGQEGYKWLPIGTKAQDITTFITQGTENGTISGNDAYLAGKFIRDYQTEITMVDSYE